MADSFIVAHLKSLPMFASLSPTQASHLTDAVTVQRFSPGDLIFRERQPAEAMVKFVEGAGRLWKVDQHNQQQLVGTVGANQYLNDTALIRDSIESATLQVIEPSLVILIYRRALIDLLGRHPDIRAAVAVEIEGVPAANPPAQPPPSSLPGVAPRRPHQRSRPNMPVPQQPQQQPAQPQQQPAQPQQQPAQPRQPEPKPDKIADEPFAVVDKQKKSFRSQRDGEEVIFDARRHWWAYVRKAWLPTLVAFIIIGLSTMLPASVAVAMDGFALVSFAVIMLYFYLEWRNDHLIVTNQRVLHIERIILTFQQKISDTSFDSVQEVNVDEFTEDPFSRIFQFGKIQIRTPGDSGNIEFTVVPEPVKLQRMIFEKRNAVKQRQEARHEDEIRSVIDRVVMGEDPDQILQEQANESKPEVKMKRSWLGWQRRSNETGEVIYRKHWLFWLRHTIWPALVIFLSLVLFVGTFTSGALQALGAIGPLFAFLVFLIGGIWFYWADWDWRNDMYIINDETIELVHKRPLWLQSESDQVFLNRIDNVLSDKSGLLQTLFDYGDVRLSLVGADVANAKVFRYVPNPQEVQAEITRRQEIKRQMAQKREEIQRQQEIADYLRAYHDTVGGRDGSYGAPINPTDGQSRGQGGRMRPPNVPRSR